MDGSTVKRFVWWIAPHGLATRRIRERRRELDAQNRVAANARYAAIREGEERKPQTSYQDLWSEAIALGVEPDELYGGSIGQASLDFVLEQIEGGPGLHVGNYAGLSLAYLAANLDSIVVAVDPNVVHRGLHNPQNTVVRLVSAAGAQDRVVLVCGYSDRKNPSNDGWVFADYDPEAEFASEAAPERVLANLRALGMKFRWVLMDGNHDADYLRSELSDIAELVDDGGLVFLDDCSEMWPQIREVFRSPADGWSAEGTDGRIGVLRKT